MPEETSPHLLPGDHDQRLGAEQDQLSGGSTGTSSGTSQETETHMVPAHHALKRPLKTIPRDTLEGGRRLGPQKIMLNGQRQRIDFPAHVGTAHGSLSNRGLEENLLWIVSHVLPTTSSVKRLT